MLQLDKAVLSSGNASLAYSACCDAAVLALIHTQVALPDKRADHLAVRAVQDAEDGQAVGGGLVADCAADRGCQLRGRCVAIVPLQQRAICFSDMIILSTIKAMAGAPCSAAAAQLHPIGALAFAFYGGSPRSKPSHLCMQRQHRLAAGLSQHPCQWMAHQRLHLGLPQVHCKKIRREDAAPDEMLPAFSTVQYRLDMLKY